MDECFDQSNKERPPLSAPFLCPRLSIYVCACAPYPGTSAVTMRWDENEGRQPGEWCRKQRDSLGGLHSISAALDPAHLLPNNGGVTMNQRHTEIWDMEVGRTHSNTHRQQTHTCTQSLTFLYSSVLPSSSLIFLFLFPSLWDCLSSNQLHQQANHCATPQRLSVTFSALGSISPVIIGCLFYCASTTIVAVSLQTGMLLLMPIVNRPGHFVGPKWPRFPDGMYRLGI